MCFTHDSLALGEDGPTHQPVEHLASLRAIPNLLLIRPADANETAVAWQVAMTTRDRPVLLVLTRQALPTLDRNRYAAADGLRRGALCVNDKASREPELILIASGSEVALIWRRANAWRVKGSPCVVSRCRVGSCSRPCPRPSATLYCRLRSVARLAVELGVRQGWERYIGSNGDMLGGGTFRRPRHRPMSCCANTASPSDNVCRPRQGAAGTAVISRTTPRKRGSIVNKQDTAFYSLLNEIAQGKSEIRDPAEVDTLERLISFNYAQAVARRQPSAVGLQRAQMTPMGRLSWRNAKQQHIPSDRGSSQPIPTPSSRSEPVLTGTGLGRACITTLSLFLFVGCLSGPRYCEPTARQQAAHSDRETMP